MPCLALHALHIPHARETDHARRVLPIPSSPLVHEQPPLVSSLYSVREAVAGAVTEDQSNFACEVRLGAADDSVKNIMEAGLSRDISTRLQLVEPDHSRLFHVMIIRSSAPGHIVGRPWPC